MKYLAKDQIMLYIALGVGLMETLCALGWGIIHLMLQHEEDPNVIASLEKKRKNLVVSGVIGVSLLGIIQSIGIVLGYSF